MLAASIAIRPATARARAISARLHQPPVERGTDGHGLRVRCGAPAATRTEISSLAACPATRNGIWRRAKWRWEGKTLGQICNQIKDRQRNGNRSLDDIVHHIGTDTLVGWAWTPVAGGSRRLAHSKSRERLWRPG